MVFCWFRACSNFYYVVNSSVGSILNSLWYLDCFSSSVFSFSLGVCSRLSWYSNTLLLSIDLVPRFPVSSVNSLYYTLAPDGVFKTTGSSLLFLLFYSPESGIDSSLELDFCDFDMPLTTNSSFDSYTEDFKSWTFSLDYGVLFANSYWSPW